MNPLHLAQYLVNAFGHVPGGVSPLKVQKLLYYVKAWSLVDGADLVDGRFERWPHGPVNREVYEHFRGHGRNAIQPMTLSPGEEPQGAARDFVDFIGHSYARFPAIALSKMTHEEAPWKQTSSGAVIAEALMRSFYAEQPFAQNIPFDPVRNPYVPVEGHMDRALTFDMGEADARRASTFASYEAYLERLHRAGFASEDEWLNGLLA
jgi:uncharacterized phage-associated protein